MRGLFSLKKSTQANHHQVSPAVTKDKRGLQQKNPTTSAATKKNQGSPSTVPTSAEISSSDAQVKSNGVPQDKRLISTEVSRASGGEHYQQPLQPPREPYHQMDLNVCMQINIYIDVHRF